VSAIECRAVDPHAHREVPGPEWIDAILGQLRRDKYRITQPRMAVLRWVADREAPFSAEEVVAEIDLTLPAGSRATVYRFLLWLREQGWLTRVHRTDRDHALVRQLPGHHQVVCVACGETLVIGGCDLTPLIGKSLTGTGFAVESHQLSIYGRCRSCASA
jgi:Fur family ferric uptake transcriptional regulator